MDRERIVVLFFFGLLALITYQLYAVISPFLTAIMWAILLAFMAHPALTALNRRIKNRSACALITTIVIALGVILPAVWLSAHLVREAQTLYAGISNISGREGVAQTGQWIRGTRLGARLEAVLASRGLRLEDQIRYFSLQGATAISQFLLKNGGAVAGNVAVFLFHFLVALTTFFYLLRDGEYYYEAIRALTPMHDEDKAAVFETLRSTLSAVMRGLMLTSLLDGFALGLGYLVLGVPYWELLALLSAAGGLLPIGGTALVWVPVAGYVAYTSGWTAALILVAWAALVLAVIDNVVKPLAMGHGTGLPTVALFFGLAGGIEAYGPLGIFAGPAVIAVFAALLRVYRRTYVREEPTIVTPPPEVGAEPRHSRRKLKESLANPGWRRFGPKR
jgi:predicted PurR-regulated permease PerM